MAAHQPALVRPFWVRIATETSFSPGWLLIAFPAVLYPIYLALEVLFGRGLAAAMDFAGDYDARMVAFWATMVGYISMMCVYISRGTFRDLEALRPMLRGGEVVFADLRKDFIRFDGRRLWVGGFVGIAFFFVFAEVAMGRWSSLLAGEWSLRATCIVAAASAWYIIIGRGCVYLVDSSRLYSRIGERQVTIDLLDLAPLSSLTHHGLRAVLTLVGIMAPGVALVSVGTSFEFASPIAAQVVLASLSGLALAAAAFLLPVRGLRRQIRARKAEKLAQLRDEIRQNEKLVAGSGTESAEAGAKLPGLLAYMEKIESVREWPFDAPTLTRFFLYVAIPLGSWVGGALVERLLGAALD